MHCFPVLYVYLIFIEGASHPVPQRTEGPLHLGALLHLLHTILLFIVPSRSGSEFNGCKDFIISSSLLKITTSY